jgi:hypothetical protein
MASNFNSTTPAAPTGSLNVTWQTDGSGNDSAYFTAPFDVPIFAPGIGTNNQKLLRIKMTRTVTFPASAVHAEATASASSTGTAIFTLSKNGTPFATATFTTAASGVWVQGADANFTPGDLLEVDGPASADTTLADVGLTLYGYRTV